MLPGMWIGSRAQLSRSMGVPTGTKPSGDPPPATSGGGLVTAPSSSVMWSGVDPRVVGRGADSTDALAKVGHTTKQDSAMANALHRALIASVGQDAPTTATEGLCPQSCRDCTPRACRSRPARHHP